MIKIKSRSECERAVLNSTPVGRCPGLMSSCAFGAFRSDERVLSLGALYEMVYFTWARNVPQKLLKGRFLSCAP